ncbi:MAG: RloB domain-containing protein [Myxococcales bacterium]|nr:MAG: RloB domain-containing protein [Myxococcales bacterium]
MVIRRSSLLDRSVQQRDARLFWLIVEGAETEPTYFRSLEARGLLPTHRVKLQVLSPPNNASAPLHLEALAEDTMARVRREPMDEVWLVFDVDLQSGSNRVRQIHEVDQFARQKGWGIAVSNPCFEVWYLLHLTDDLSSINHSCASVETALRRELGSYSKRTTPARCLEQEALTSAIARARSLDASPRSPIPDRGSRLHLLLDRLRSYR